MRCLNPFFKVISNSYRFTSKYVPFKTFLKSPRSFIEDADRKIIEIPCGKCVFCLNKKVNEWSLRIKHELQFFRRGLFITLTYNELEVPRTSDLKTSLCKSDLQKFFKRLRYYLDKENRKIKYYACGEYGDKTDRAHYHAIILGMDILNKHDIELVRKSWKFGFIHFGDATVKSGRYVAKYCNKIHEDYNYKMRYLLSGREAPFKVSSIRLGYRYVISEKENIYNNLYIQNSDYKISIPRTYLRWLKKSYSDISDKLKEKTKKFQESNFYKLVEHYSSRLSEKYLDFIFNRVRHISRLNIVLKNNFLEELSVYDLCYYPRLYDLYHQSLIRKAQDLKIKEKRKLDDKKLAIF